MSNVYQMSNPGAPSQPPSGIPPHSSGVPVTPPVPAQYVGVPGGAQPAPPSQWPGQPSAQPEPSGSSGGSKRLKVLLGVAVVVILGMAGGIGYLVMSDNDQAAAPSTTQPEEATPSEGSTSDDADQAAPSAASEGEYEIPEIPMNDDLSNLTDVQREGAEIIRDHMESSPMGRRSAITFLMSMPGTQFSEEDATAAVDGLEIDWVVAAKAAALGYLNSDGFSKQGLINYLTGDFTNEEATAAVEGLEAVDWSIQAERYARDTADLTATSRSDLLSLMTDPVSGAAFEQAEAEKGIEDAKIDFNDEAVEAAQEWIDDFPDEANCGAVTHILEVSDFTPDEVTHGASEVGAC